MKKLYIRNVPDEIYEKMEARKKAHEGDITAQVLRLLVREYDPKPEASP